MDNLISNLSPLAAIVADCNLESKFIHPHFKSGTEASAIVTLECKGDSKVKKMKKILYSNWRGLGNIYLKSLI